MKTFTIDAENNTTVFATKKEAAAASTTPFDSFANQSELAELTAGWPVQRLIEIWNGIPGVNAVTKFTSRKIATERIWKAVQSLGDRSPDVPPAQPEEPIAAIPEASPASEPGAETTNGPAAGEFVPAVRQDVVAIEEKLAAVGEQVPDATPAETKPTNEASPAKKAPKANTEPKPTNAEAGPRAESKTAQVVAMLKRDGGATLAEIMSSMGWQKHTVRGFMAGAMKKAGYTVESFRNATDERTYRIK